MIRGNNMLSSAASARRIFSHAPSAPQIDLGEVDQMRFTPARSRVSAMKSPAVLAIWSSRDAVRRQCAAGGARRRRGNGPPGRVAHFERTLQKRPRRKIQSGARPALAAISIAYYAYCYLFYSRLLWNCDPSGSAPHHEPRKIRLQPNRRQGRNHHRHDAKSGRPDDNLFLLLLGLANLQSFAGRALPIRRPDPAVPVVSKDGRPIDRARLGKRRPRAPSFMRLGRR